MAQVNLPPGFEIVDEPKPDAALPEGFVVEGATLPRAEPEGSGGTSAAIATLQGVPAAVRGVARVVANHPGATQKAINAGFTGTAASVGGAIGGVPGAIAGGAVRGVAPTQAGIREVAGRFAGETPNAARTAGRAVGVANYAKETYGLPLKPTDLVSSGTAAKAVDSYAESAGLRVPRVLDQYGKVVFGPEAAAASKAPGIAGRLLTKGAGVMSKLSPFLSPLQGMAAVSDLAQTADPNRHDIGILGIGRSQPQPTMDEALKANAPNQQRAEAQYQALLREAMLAKMHAR